MFPIVPVVFLVFSSHFNRSRDADASAVSFRYRRADQPGKVYLFKTAGSGESGPGISGERGPAQFFLGEKGGNIMSADVDLEPLQQCRPKFFESEGFFEVCWCARQEKLHAENIFRHGRTNS